MCGRLRLDIPFAEIAKAIDIMAADGPAPNVRPSWNTPPTGDALIVYLHPETRKRVAYVVRWGMIPRWSEDGRTKYPNHVARAETVRDKPTFRAPWREAKRCLVITNGYYEFRERDKQPFALARTRERLTIMAGLWETWIDPKTGEVIKSAAIITTTPNSLIAPYHDRMPVLLAETDWPRWLGELPISLDEAYGMLRPYPADEMDLWPVSRRVNKVQNNDAGLVMPVTLEVISTLL